MVLCFPHACRPAHILFILSPIASACFLLVVVCAVVNWWPPKGCSLLHANYFCHSILFYAPNDVTTSYPTLHHSYASSPTPLLPRTPTVYWLLCVSAWCWEPKARAQRISLFFDRSLFGAPNEGTNSGKSKPKDVCLLRTHREPQSQDLRPW